MVSTPTVEPVTVAVVPEPATVARPLVELQVPPVAASVTVIEARLQTRDGPTIGDGNGLTVTTFVRLQPDDNVYATVTVPEVTPETSPDVGLTTTLPVPTPTVDHVPPDGVPNKVMVAPTQTDGFGGLIVAGIGSTVIVLVALQPVPASV
jgi:hypothetical protein